MSEEIVLEIFKNLEDKIQDADWIISAREISFIANECIALFDHYKNLPDQKKLQDFSLFKMLLFYLLEKGQFEKAEKIYRFGLCSLPPEKIIDDLIKDIRSKNHIDNLKELLVNTELLVNIDLLISFFTQIGREKEVLDIIDSKKGSIILENPELEWIINCSWLKFFNRFIDCKKKEYPQECWDLFLDISICCNNFASILKNVKTDERLFNFKKWLFKRRALGIYTAIMADYFIANSYNSSILKNTLMEFADFLCETYLNYVELIYDWMDYYVLNAKKTLEKINNTFYRYEDIPVNLIHQVEKVENRYSDIRKFFESMLDINISISKIKFQLGNEKKDILTHLKDHLEIMTNMTLDDQIKQLDDALKLIQEDKEIFLKEPEIKENLTCIKSKVLKNGDGSFWENCRKKLKPSKLSVLAASVENKYSNGTANFFTTQVVKLDNGNPIPTELCLLRKWGSTSAIFEQDKNYSANFGGGYFLYHNGFGLAIDPGPDFLRNLTYHTDFDMMDISGIVCTHTHLDHFADFNRIILGIREYKQYVGYKELYYLLPDKDDQDIFPEKLREDCVNVFEETIWDQINYWFSKIIRYNRFGKMGTYHLPNTEWGKQNGIRIQTFPVRHSIYGKESKNKRLHSYALLIMPLKNGQPITRILFSGDAQYNTDLFNGIEPELLILNCSSIRFEDITSGGLNARFSKNHLGYTGILELLKRMKSYKIAVIADFFEPQCEGDGRLLITDALKNDILNMGMANAPVQILAGEPGMRFNWTSTDNMEVCNLEVYCSPLCGSSGFVQPSQGEIAQLKGSILNRNERILMACKQCKNVKKKLLIK